MIKKYAKPIGISLFFVILAIVLVIVIRKASEGVVIRFEDPNVRMELGESFSVPSIYAYEEKSGKIVSKDVKLVELKGQDGKEVKVAYGTIIPEKIGTYTAVFKSASLALEEEVKIECVDSKAPKISFEAPSQYYIRKRGETTYQTFEVPQYTYDDYSGINEEKSGLSIILNGKEVEYKNNTFTLTEWGQLEFKVVAVDGVGNKNVYTSIASAYEPYEDPSLEPNVLSDFNEEEYIRTLSYGYANRKFNVEFMEEYADSTNMVEKGVLKVTANSESTCDVMFAAEVKRSQVDYIDLRVCLQNASVKSAAINPYNFAVGESGKQFLMGRYTKAYLQENVWTTIRVSGKEYLDSLVEDGIMKGFTLHLHSPQKESVIFYIDEITYGKFHTDKTLQDGILATFDNASYTNNIVEFYTKDSAVTTSANKLEYLSFYADKNGVKETGVVKAEYYKAIGDITTQVVLPKPVKRSSVNRIVLRIAQTGVRVCDEITKQIMVTSPLAEDIWGTAYESFEIAENEWTYLCISNPMLLDALAGEDGYIRSINLTHFRKNDEECRTLYLAGAHSYWTDSNLNKYVLADYDEDAYAIHNVSRGVAIWDETNRLNHKEIISSYADKKNETKTGVLHLRYNATKAEKKYFDFTITFGKAIKRSNIEALKVTLAQTGVATHSGLKTFFVTSACKGNDIWTDDGRYAIYELQENQWTTIEIPEKVLDAATDSDGYIRALSFYSEAGVKNNANAAHIYIDAVTYLTSPYEDENLGANCLADYTEPEYVNNARKGAAVGTSPAGVEVLSSYTDKLGVNESGVLKVTGTPNEKNQYDFSLYFGRKIAYSSVASIKIRIAQTNINSDGPLKTFFVTSNTKGNDIWTDDGRYAIYGVADNKWTTITIPKSVLKHAQDEDGYISSLSLYSDNGLVKNSVAPVIYVSEVKYVANANTVFEDSHLAECVLADFTEADYKYNAKKGVAVETSPESATVVSSYTDRAGVSESGVLKITAEPNENDKFDFSIRFGKKIAYKSVDFLTIRIAQTNISSDGPLKTFFVASNTKGNDIWTDDGRFAIYTVSDNEWTTLTIPKSVLEHAQDKNGYISSLSFFCDNGLVHPTKDAVIYVAEVAYMPVPYEDKTLEESVLADFTEASYKYNAREGVAIGTMPASTEVVSSYTDKADKEETGVLKIVVGPNGDGKFDFSVHFGKKIAYSKVDAIKIKIAQTNIAATNGLKTFFVTSNTEGNDIWTDDGRYAIYEVTDDTWTTITIPKSVLEHAQDEDGYISSLSFFCDNGLVDSAKEAVVYIAEVSYIPPIYKDSKLETGVLADFAETDYEDNVRQGVAVGTWPGSTEVVSSYTDKGGKKETGVLKITGVPNDAGKFDFSLHFGQKVAYSDVEIVRIRIAQTNIKDPGNGLRTFFVTSNTKGGDIWNEGCYAIYGVAENEWTTITIPKNVLEQAQDEDGNISSLSIFCDNGLVDSAKEAIVYVSEIVYVSKIYEDDDLSKGVLADFTEGAYRGNARQGVAVGTMPANTQVISSYKDQAGIEETGVLKITGEPNVNGKFDFSVYFGQKIAYAEASVIKIRIAQTNIKDPGNGLRTFFVTSNTKGGDIWTDDGRYVIYGVAENEWTTITIPRDVLKHAQDEEGYISSLSFFCDNGLVDSAKEAEVYISEVSYVPFYSDNELAEKTLADFKENSYKYNAVAGAAVLTSPKAVDVLDSYEDAKGSNAEGVLKIVGAPNANGKFDFSVHFGKKIAYSEVDTIQIRIAQTNVKDPGYALRTFFVTSNTKGGDIWNEGYYAIYGVVENEWTTITIPNNVLQQAQDGDGYISSLSFFCDNGMVDTSKEAVIYIDEVTYTKK